MVPLGYHDIISACELSGCPICRLVESSVKNYLDSLLYEQVNDVGVRDNLRRGLGFCNIHAHQLLEISRGGSLGIAIIYRDVIHATLGKMPSLKPASSLKLIAGDPCAVCEHRHSVETDLLDTVLITLNEGEMHDALESSAGLCLLHLNRILELARDEPSFNTLRALAQNKFTTLHSELDEFIRKNDYRFHHEPLGSEGNSWQRVIDMLTSSKGMR